MGNSLQDQLRKVGLVSEQQAKQSRTTKRKNLKNEGNKGRLDDESRRRAQQVAKEKARRDSELNRQRRDEARRRAEADELRQLIHTNRIPRGDGDIAYSFVDGGKVRRIYVSADQQAKLAKGQLALVRQDTGYEIVSTETAERVQARNAQLVVLLFNRQNKADCPEDEYSDYEIPDDLMW